jgi:hypothetical protein
MKKISITIVGFILAGCAFTRIVPNEFGETRTEFSVLTSRQQTQFIDSDGASYEMALQASAAAKIDRTAGQFGYTFSSDDLTSGSAEGAITVGTEQTGLNQEAQTKIVDAVVSGVVQGIAKAAGVP